MTAFRTYLPSDSEALSECARICGQTGEVSAENARYQEFLAISGQLLVCESESTILGFAGLVDRSGVAFLTDLFVHPDHQDRGLGRRLLHAVWDNASRRMTSASQDPRALALYSHCGATPRWKNLYLEFEGQPPSSNADIRTMPAKPGDCGWNFAMPNSHLVNLYTADGEIQSSAVVASDPQARTLQVLRAITPDPSTLPLLVEHLRGHVGPDGTVMMNLPDVHPALNQLVDARMVDADVWCADDAAADVIDPTRELPSPSFG
jgi:GNAT superfamily N-acetyltransferase